MPTQFIQNESHMNLFSVVILSFFSLLLLFLFFLFSFCDPNDHNGRNRKRINLEVFSVTLLTYQFSNRKIFFFSSMQP